MSEKHDVQHQSMNDLVQAESMAYFRADLAESMPESYSLEEKRRICDEMIQSTAAILDAMRADFQARSPEEQRELLADLCSDPDEDPQWWWDVLVGAGDPLYQRGPRR